jgi:hypothetical protein
MGLDPAVTGPTGIAMKEVSEQLALFQKLGMLLLLLMLQL